MKTTVLILATAIALIGTACNEHEEHAIHDGSNMLSGGLTDMENDNALAASCFQAMGKAQWMHLGLSEEQLQGVLRLQQGMSEVNLSTSTSAASPHGRDSSGAASATKGDDRSSSIAGGSDGVEQNTSGYGQLPDSSATNTENSAGTDHGIAKGRIGNIDSSTMQELESVLSEEQLVRLKKLCASGTDEVHH